MVMSRRQKEKKHYLNLNIFIYEFRYFFLLNIFHSLSCWVQRFHERWFFCRVFCIVYSSISHVHLSRKKYSKLSESISVQQVILCTLSNNISSMYLVRICFQVVIKLWRKTFTKENNICHNKDSPGYIKQKSNFQI